jgi:amino acid transporter
VLQRSTFSRTADVIAVVALVVVWATVAICWHKLPAEIPHHFDLNGQPDGWGSRNYILVLPGLALLSFLARPPRSTTSLAKEFSAALRAVVLLGFAWSTIAVVCIAMGKAASLGRWFAPCLLVAIVTVSLCFGFRSKGSRKQTV